MRNRSQKGFAGSGRCCELHEVPQHEEQWRCLRPSGNIFSDGLAEIIQGHAQALIKLYFRLPAEEGASLGDVGTALFGVILRESFVANLAAGPRDGDNALRAFEDGELVRIADVDRLVLVGFREANEAIDFVSDVAEAAGL